MTTTFVARLPKAGAEALARALELPLEEIGVAYTLFESGDAWEVTVYAEPDALAKAEPVLANAGATFERFELADEDWVARSLRSLAPVRAGGFVVHGSHDRGTARAGETAIEIDANRAFGTGHHGTTAGCLEAIDRVLRRGRPDRMIDLGTGSGVLAIGLAKRCRRPVLATDIDFLAVRIAAANARTNGVGHLVRTVRAVGLAHGAVADASPFSLVVANILAGPLRAMAPAIARSLAPGGAVILSGLLERQRSAVLAAYRAQGLVHRGTILREGWATLTLRHPVKGI